MTLLRKAYDLADSAPIPDVFVRMAIATLVGRTSKRLAHENDPGTTTRFVDDLKRLPIAIHADAANEQHYEVPASFFELVLGPQRKYSCCYYDNAETSLADAESRALALTAEHATLDDGQTILELGCGWGSLSLWMARNYPRSNILAVSNSRSQRAFIVARAEKLGLTNLQVITADMNVFATERKFDRIVSVEMFEHMANWHDLLRRCRDWLAPQGRMFLHIFTHSSTPYRFDHADMLRWMFFEQYNHEPNVATLRFWLPPSSRPAGDPSTLLARSTPPSTSLRRRVQRSMASRTGVGPRSAAVA